MVEMRHLDTKTQSNCIILTPSPFYVMGVTKSHPETPPCLVVRNLGVVNGVVDSLQKPNMKDASIFEK